MKMHISSFVIALSAVASLSAAAPSQPGVVAVSFEKVPGQGTGGVVSTKHQKRDDDDVSGPNTLINYKNNYFLEYLVTFEAGTPGQQFQALIDTGSSDVWVYGQNANGPGFDSSKSSTFTDLHEEFSIVYAAGPFKGEWVNDTIAIGDAKVENYQFAVVPSPAEDRIPTDGVFGVAYPHFESTYNPYTGESTYPNFPIRLRDQGTIETASFSFFLDDWDSKTGTFLFGGLDAAKYSGQLYTVPIADTGIYGRAAFNIADIKVSLNGGSESESFSAILDTGTGLSYLPDDIVESIANNYGGQYDNNVGRFLFPNGGPSANDYVTFDFSGAEIRVPSSEFVRPLSEISDQKSDNTPALTFVPAGDSNAILGDTFLRSAYVVFDLDHALIGLAQAKWDATTSNILPITSNGIPGAQPAPSL